MTVEPRAFRFGEFELDARSGELRKNGRKIRLAEQPFQVLQLLLAHPGELVTREEVRQALWPDATFVDFEAGLNSAVWRLREALSDSADNPQFVETVPRRGYRLIATVEGAAEPAVAAPPAQTAEVGPAAATDRKRIRLWGAAAALAASAILVTFLAVSGSGTARQEAATPVQIQSLAVLPFENLTGDPEQDYFADGMTDALTSDLAQIRALRVISRTSAMQYKGAKTWSCRARSRGRATGSA